jgi:uncharacterized protein YjiS (DUF1127 family)
MQNIVTLTESHTSGPFAVKLKQHLAAWWSCYMAWRTRRASLRILRALDDRTLRDIGLTRGQIENAVGSTRRPTA